MTAVATSTYTAANWNTYIRDNLNATGVGLMTSGIGRHMGTTGTNGIAERTSSVNSVATLQSTTSTTFADLLTTGPALTITTGVNCLVSFGAMALNTTAGLGARVAPALSGATTQAASDTNSTCMESGNASDSFQFTWCTVYAGITAGSNTWTLKYRAVGGGTATYSNRWLALVPF